MQPKLYLLMGYPGAGKTTAAKIIKELISATYVSSDDERSKIPGDPVFSSQEHEQIYKTLNATTEDLLGSGQSVIYDANLNRYKHRKEKYDICQRVGAEPILLWVQTEKSLAKQRAVSRGKTSLIPADETPAEIFDRIANIIEEPRPEENAIIVDGTKISTDYLNSLLFKN